MTSKLLFFACELKVVLIVLLTAYFNGGLCLFIARGLDFHFPDAITKISEFVESRGTGLCVPFALPVTRDGGSCDRVSCLLISDGAVKGGRR